MPSASNPRLFDQPASVWAITFATAVSFVGIGLVSPILPTIATALDATAFESMLLFTSYLFVTGCTMFFAGVISARIGVKNTLLAGLSIIVLFASMAGLSDTIGQIIGLRAGWGFGNALFVTMALAGIVGSANGGSAKAIILYEAALGFGMALGPLVGGTLGSISWRAPFLGTAVLMAIAATTVMFFVKPLPRAEVVPITAGFAALKRRPLLIWAVSSFMMNFTIVCVLAYAPHAVSYAAQASGVTDSALMLGLVFFGWGAALAVFSLTLPAPLMKLLGIVPAVIVALVLVMVGFTVVALNTQHLTVVIVGIICLGGFQGTASTLFTEAALNATDLPRPIASSSYSAVRFFGGAVFPLVSAPSIALWGDAGPFWASLIAAVCAIVLLLAGYRALPPAQRRRGALLAPRRVGVAAHTRTPGV